MLQAHEFPGLAYHLVHIASEMLGRGPWRVRACASTHLRRLLGLFEDMLSSSQICHVQQLLAVQNVDPVNPILDHAVPFALLAMSNAAQLEYAHH